MKIKSGFVIEQVGGSYLAVATGERAASFRALIRLNDTGAFLWKLLSEGDMTKEELLSRMLEEYDVTEELAKRDITKFLEMLLKADILDA